MKRDVSIFCSQRVATIAVGQKVLSQQFAPLGSLHADIQKKVGQGAFKLDMDDILYTNYWRIRSSSPENVINTFFKSDYHNQFIRLTYGYTFGRNKLKSVNLKSGADKERNRVN
ncbi:MAG: hypothetical protein ABIS36_10730 [Chryseolinea sp.]